MFVNASVMASPAVAVVGRHNSGKTTLVERVIAELTARGLDVGSVKHHGHAGFDIDIPGKDSWRHRQAGATETIISSPGKVAGVKTIDGEAECSELVAGMPGHDLVVVEGYRKSGVPTIEIMRAANGADAQVAHAFWEGAQQGEPLSTDYVQAARASRHAAQEQEPAPGTPVDPGKMPLANTVAVVTDIEEARKAAEIYRIPAFGFDDISELCTFLQITYARPHTTVVIQAGGESRRMGRSKATVPFLGRPLIMRLVERTAPAADELVITTNEPENLEFLHEAYPDLHIRLVRDALEYRGALPGLYTAFKEAKNEQVAVVACDMVFASPRLIAAECRELARTGADAVIPVNKNGYEPFHAVYRRTVCLSAAKKMLDAGDKRAQAIFPHINVDEFPQSRVLAAEPRGRCFINANTPDDLHYTEQLALKE